MCPWQGVQFKKRPEHGLNSRAGVSNNILAAGAGSCPQRRSSPVKLKSSHPKNTSAATFISNKNRTHGSRIVFRRACVHFLIEQNFLTNILLKFSPSYADICKWKSLSFQNSTEKRADFTRKCIFFIEIFWKCVILNMYSLAFWLGGNRVGIAENKTEA